MVKGFRGWEILAKQGTCIMAMLEDLNPKP